MRAAKITETRAVGEEPDSITEGRLRLPRHRSIKRTGTNKYNAPTKERRERIIGIDMNAVQRGKEERSRSGIRSRNSKGYFTTAERVFCMIILELRKEIAGRHRAEVWWWGDQRRATAL